MKKRLLLFAAVSAFLAYSISCESIHSLKNVAVEECNIENEGTRKFLDEVDYSNDTAYTVSYDMISYQD